MIIKLNMRSIKARFKKIEKENPYYSSFSCFAKAVSGQNFTRESIVKNFTELVDKEDFDAEERMNIIVHLSHL